MEGEMNLNQSLFDQEQAKAAALEEARASIWSGIGDIASGVSSGMMGIANQKAQMAMLNKIYGGGSTGGDVLTGARAFASNAIGSGTSLAKILNPNFGQMEIFPKSGYSLPYEAMMSRTMPIKRDIIKK
jgi:hypothetical protein